MATTCIEAAGSELSLMLQAADDKVSTAAASAALQSLLSRLTSKGPQEMPQDSPRYSQDPLGDTLGDTGYLAEPDSPVRHVQDKVGYQCKAAECAVGRPTFNARRLWASCTHVVCMYACNHPLPIAHHHQVHRSRTTK